MYRNNHDGSFTAQVFPTGVDSSSAAWGDVDNDGDMDAIVTGDTGAAYISRVYRNDNSTFNDIVAGLPGVSEGSTAWGDYDHDGNLDILLGGDGSTS